MKKSILPKVGDKFLCIKDVEMKYEDGQFAQVSYYKNITYMCENDGCITDEQGDFNHTWHSIKNLKKYFIKL